MVERVLFGPGGATEVTLALIKAKTDNLDVALSTRGVTGITDTQMRATPVPVSGTVTVGNFPGTQPVSGTFFQGTQPVSGPLTDTQLRAAPPAIKDDFLDGQVLAQQSGPGVLTFTFSAPVNLVVVESSGDALVSRVDPFGGVPSATVGWPARHETPNYMPVITSAVQVYAPSGATVNVMGYRR